MIVALYDRIRKGKNLVEADPNISHAANFLLMLNGEKPSATAAKALDVALVLARRSRTQRFHLRCRVTAATLSDMHSAITSAIWGSERPAAWRRQRSGFQDAEGNRREG